MGMLRGLQVYPEVYFIFFRENCHNLEFLLVIIGTIVNNIYFYLYLFTFVLIITISKIPIVNISTNANIIPGFSN